mmetsp:Transcript_60783/g.188791  ORF Transcript_60783/g.188791 Transcript_60783/m.188791 type:complete len:201 (-) Transcript_60783:107-709(-)
MRRAGSPAPLESTRPTRQGTRPPGPAPFSEPWPPPCHPPPRRLPPWHPQPFHPQPCRPRPRRPRPCHPRLHRPRPRRPQPRRPARRDGRIAWRAAAAVTPTTAVSRFTSTTRSAGRPAPRAPGLAPCSRPPGARRQPRWHPPRLPPPAPASGRGAWRATAAAMLASPALRRTSTTRSAGAPAPPASTKTISLSTGRRGPA